MYVILNKILKFTYMNNKAHEQKLSKFLRKNGTGLLTGMFKFTRIEGTPGKGNITIAFSMNEIFLGSYIAEIITEEHKLIEIKLLDDPQVEIELTTIYEGKESIGTFLAMYNLVTSYE